MKSGHLSASLGLAVCMLGGGGCVGDGGSSDLEEVSSTSAPIQGGQLETGYPAVGEVAIGGGFCSGTLIAPSYVLTAAHCAGAGMVFKTGNSSADFVDHPVAQQIIHPTLDLLIAHLASPITNITPVQFNDGALPPVGEVCTGVGFGWYDTNGVTTYGTKRSATEQVTSANTSQIVVHMVTGIADHGDSGGPLLCSNGIAAVVHNHTDGVWPAHVSENYTTIDAGWIQDTIAPTYTELALQNGWTNAPYSTRNAGVAFVSDQVQLKGAIASGTSSVAFTLPIEFRPATNVYVPVDLCGAKKGRLLIQPSGTVSVQAESAFADAQCFTSLEGVSFAPSASGFTGLTLQNGWLNAPFGTSNAAAELVGGMVHLKGAISSGTSSVAFTLPSGLRPATDVYVPVDLCSAHKGRLYIQPSGTALIVTNGPFSDAQCFTSLDGVSFAQDPSTFSALTLQNGWTGAPYSTGAPGIEELSGVVRFKGGIASGASGYAFTLPAGLRPVTNVYVPVNLCNATKGRLLVQPSGDVSVQSEGAFSDAQCFTSLEGAAFTKSDFTPVVLQNGWTNAPFATTDAAFSLTGGILHLKGAIANGSTGLAFNLPIGFRPATNIYVPVDLCAAKNGRILVQSNGDVSVQAEGTFADAQCFTSLEGASFALGGSFTALALQNGWTNAPYGTRNAAVTNDGGIIRLEGAIASGASGLAFNLPVGFRPAATVYVPVDLCNAHNGRLIIQPSGDVSVQAENAFSDAQCFTSLEGAAFALSTGGFSALTLQNGWVNYGTRNAMATNDVGIIRLEGAISSGTTGLAFTLPSGMRPATTVYVPVDLCNAHKGRLIIQPSGDVTVQAQGAFSDAQCFTSLEGAAFAL